MLKCLMVDLLQLSIQLLSKLQLMLVPHLLILSMNDPPGLVQHGSLLPLSKWIATSTTGESPSLILEQLGEENGGGLI